MRHFGNAAAAPQLDQLTTVQTAGAQAFARHRHASGETLGIDVPCLRGSSRGADHGRVSHMPFPVMRHGNSTR
jgi:hypothetical protein